MQLTALAPLASVLTSSKMVCVLETLNFSNFGFPLLKLFDEFSTKHKCGAFFGFF
jgi:hypothetical protein